MKCTSISLTDLGNKLFDVTKKKSPMRLLANNGIAWGNNQPNEMLKICNWRKIRSGELKSGWEVIRVIRSTHQRKSIALEAKWIFENRKLDIFSPSWVHYFSVLKRVDQTFLSNLLLPRNWEFYLYWVRKKYSFLSENNF